MSVMGYKSKVTILLLAVALVASSLISVQGYVIDSIAKPSTPEFTVQLVSHPYDVPAKTTTIVDQYTGKETTTTQPGYHVENKSIEITIKNQLFTPYTLTEYTYYYRNFDKDGSVDGSYTVDGNKTVNFYFHIQVKGHFGDSWQLVGERYAGFDGPQSNVQTGSRYTVISIGEDYPEGTLLDVRVQARIGYYVAYGPGLAILGYDFYGQESDWSSIQTLDLRNAQTTIPPPTTPPTLVPTITPTLPPASTLSPIATPVQPDPQTESNFTLSWEQDALIICVAVIAALIIVLVVSRRKKA
jgi:hypothetical protein